MATAGSLYGYEIESELPLRRLLPAPGSRGRLTLRRATGSLLPAGGTVVHETASPESSFTLTRAGDRLHIACSASGEFLLDRGGELLASPLDCDDDFWEHRAVTAAIPLLLAERGDLVLHAAAIATGSRAIVLTGSTGRGKSTTALAGATLGYPLLAEDGAAVDLSGGDPLVWPGPRGVRVGPAVSAALGVAEEWTGGKRTIFPPGITHAHDPVPLGAVVVLADRGPELAVERIDAAAAMPLVLPHLVYGGSDRLVVAFAQCARLVAAVRVYRCSLPDDVAALPEALERLLGGVSPGAAPARG